MSVNGDRPAVQLINVAKQYGKKTVVNNLTMAVHRGEVFGLLGPNGAGKTTIIRMLVGLIAITRGDILIRGINIKKDYYQAIAQIGALVENPEFYKFLTGYQNLLHYANMHPGITAKRIDDVVMITGLANRIDDKVKTYSLGMRQRLGIAQALLHQPPVLILDEPTNGLDPEGIKKLREYLQLLAHAEGVTVIVSSHLLSEMELMCDRFAILKMGRLVKTQINDRLQVSEQSTIIFDVDNPTNALAVIKCNLATVEINPVDDLLAVQADRATVAAITECLVGAGIKIYGIQRKTRSLEELYLESTGGGEIV